MAGLSRNENHLKHSTKTLKRILVFSFMLIMLFSTYASAAENTTYTYNISVSGEWTRTQFAYTPVTVYMRNQELKNPSDIFYYNNELYISDTGNKRIVIMNLDSGATRIIGEGMLTAPRGVFVNDKGTYVADPESPAVFCFSQEGNLINKIERPKTRLFGESTAFQPKNLVISSEGNMFVVGIGNHEGLMQFDEAGNFQGFFAANKRSLNFTERIQELIFTKEQKASLTMRISRAIENIDMTERDLVYSVTQSAAVTYSWRKAEEKTENHLKLHNMAGKNILSPNKNITDEWNFVDVVSGSFGNSYTLTQTGIINEYDSQGNLLFSFGGRAVSDNRLGLFTNAAAIEVDEKGVLYILDSEQGIIQTFVPTEYAHLTHQAIESLEKGEYGESEKIWRSLLRLNGMSKFAHIGYGRSLFHQQKFEQALKHFKIANEKENYSETYWEIRNSWMTKNISAIIIIAVLILVLLQLKKKFWKKKTPVRVKTDKLSVYLKDIKFSLYMIRHPIDGYYYLKRGIHGSILSAATIYLLLFIVFLTNSLFKGFLFNPYLSSERPLVPTTVLFFAIAAFWVLGNTMVASINEGEGSLKNIFIMTAYALSPYLLIIPFNIVLSYGLSLNEGFIISFVNIAVLVWCGVNLFIGLTETHNYSFPMTVKNVLLTLFFMVMAIVAIAMLYIMWDKIVEFAEQLKGEILYHVKK